MPNVQLNLESPKKFAYIYIYIYLPPLMHKLMLQMQLKYKNNMLHKIGFVN